MYDGCSVVRKLPKQRGQKTEADATQAAAGEEKMESQESESEKRLRARKVKVKSFGKSGREALTMLTSWKKAHNNELQNF